jgi:hypothetical protein
MPGIAFAGLICPSSGRSKFHGVRQSKDIEVKIIGTIFYCVHVVKSEEGKLITVTVLSQVSCQDCQWNIFFVLPQLSERYSVNGRGQGRRKKISPMTYGVRVSQTQDPAKSELSENEEICTPWEIKRRHKLEIYH